MARNETQLARLNRFYLQKEKEESLKKNPPRPKLDSLTSATAIQKWLPSIKRELDFYIKQSMVPCYPESTIKQFSQRIDSLKREYKAFLVRLRRFDPHLKETPWTDRPYAGQKRDSFQIQSNESSDLTESVTDAASKDESCSKKPKCAFKPLATPILDNENSLKDMYDFVDLPQIYYNVCHDQENKPLVFKPQCTVTKLKDPFPTSPGNDQSGSCHVLSTSADSHVLAWEFMDSEKMDVKQKQNFQEESLNFLNGIVDKKCDNNLSVELSDELASSHQSCVKPGTVQQTSADAIQHSLNLPYSDSEDSTDS